jgi:hypothetical protein
MLWITVEVFGLRAWASTLAFPYESGLAKIRGRRGARMLPAFSRDELEGNPT